MCGIAGIVSFKENVNLQRLKNMTDAIVHRGPDGEGQWINSEGKLGLGHRRLSIIDLSDKAKQPMHYGNRRYTITFNGEIYNYIEIKKELLTKGYQFQSESDTEVLMALYDLKKEKCLSDLDGMFSFAIWDSTEQVLFCARDRFGEKPFYYFKNENEFVFASEIKQLFAAGIPKEMNPQVLYYYFNYNTEGNPNEPEQTFFRNIVQLMPGSYLKLAHNKLSINKYWELDTKYTSDISFEDAVGKFTELFNTAVQRRLRSDVPVGSCLSGGLDSSSIVLSIDKMKAEGQIQKTFSVRFKDFDKDEGKYMAMVAQKAKSVQYHETWPSEKDFTDSISTILKFQDEPYGGASVMAQYHVMLLARKNDVTVLIDGQGSDEYLAGYTPYLTTYLNQLYGHSGKYAIEKEKIKEYHGLEHHLSFNGKMQLKYPVLFAAASKTKNAIVPSEKRGSNATNVLHPDFSKEIQNGLDPFRGKANNNLRQSVYNIINGIPFNALLRYADRNAMAHSVEVRLPFLFHELVEFANSLPDHYKIHEGWTKYILRKSMEPVLPNEITWRKDKIGFAAPQDNWFNSKNVQEQVMEAKSALKKNKIIAASAEPDQWKSLMVYLTCNNG